MASTEEEKSKPAPLKPKGAAPKTSHRIESGPRAKTCAILNRQIFLRLLAFRSGVMEAGVFVANGSPAAFQPPPRGAGGAARKRHSTTKAEMLMIGERRI